MNRCSNLAISWRNWIYFTISSDKMIGNFPVCLNMSKTSPMWLWPVKMMSDAVAGDDPALLTQCLDFCQALANKGQSFSISLKIGSSFSFSLDTRRNVDHNVVTRKKKLSPSRLRRNQRRKEEFLRRKTTPSSENEAFKCEECGNSFKSENGLKIHRGKAHKKVSTLPSPEKMRRPSGDSPRDCSLIMSPTRGDCREESQEQEQKVEEKKEEEVSPFISALSKTLSLWPEDEDEHKCPPWQRCRNLKCMLEAEKENQIWAAAGECDNCEENKNNCECEDLEEQKQWVGNWSTPWPLLQWGGKRPCDQNCEGKLLNEQFLL